jgi:hypothetical protein
LMVRSLRTMTNGLRLASLQRTLAQV